MTGKIEEKRSKGRRRVPWMSSVKEWLQDRGVKHQEVEIIERARHGKLWHGMINYFQECGTKRDRKYSGKYQGKAYCLT